MKQAWMGKMPITHMDNMRINFKKLRRSGQFPTVVSAARGIWQAQKNFRDLLVAPSAVSQIVSRAREFSVEELIDPVVDGFHGLLRPIQNKNELRSLLRVATERKPRFLLEIGTAKGGTLFLLSKAAQQDATIISCDLPGGFYGGGYPRWKAILFRKLIPPPMKLHLIRGNSHEQKSYETVRKILDGNLIDFALIDGDHSYAGVKQDFLLYRNLVRPGGSIAFHDILENRFDIDIEVFRLWREIRDKYETEEIIDDPLQGQFGIGIVKVPLSW